MSQAFFQVASGQCPGRKQSPDMTLFLNTDASVQMTAFDVQLGPHLSDFHWHRPTSRAWRRAGFRLRTSRTLAAAAFPTIRSCRDDPAGSMPSLTPIGVVCSESAVSTAPVRRGSRLPRRGGPEGGEAACYSTDAPERHDSAMHNNRDTSGGFQLQGPSAFGTYSTRPSLLAGLAAVLTGTHHYQHHHQQHHQQQHHHDYRQTDGFRSGSASAGEPGRDHPGVSLPGPATLDSWRGASAPSTQLHAACLASVAAALVRLPQALGGGQGGSGQDLWGALLRVLCGSDRVGAGGGAQHHHSGPADTGLGASVPQLEAATAAALSEVKVGGGLQRQVFLLDTHSAAPKLQLGYRAAAPRQPHSLESNADRGSGGAGAGRQHGSAASGPAVPDGPAVSASTPAGGNSDPTTTASSGTGHQRRSRLKGGKGGSSGAPAVAVAAVAAQRDVNGGSPQPAAVGAPSGGDMAATAGAGNGAGVQKDERARATERPKLLEDPSRYAKLLLAGALSAVVSRTCVAPLERVKMDLLLRTGSRDALSTFQQVLRTEGLSGFWKGNLVNVLRTAPFKAVNFFSFDLYHTLLIALAGRDTNTERFAAGACAGVTATLVCFPLDVVRTRLLASVAGPRYGAGPFATLAGILRNEGAAALYSGCVPAVIGMAPAGAVFYGLYDMLKHRHIESLAGAAAAAEGAAAGDAAAAGQSQHQAARTINPVYTLMYGAIAGAASELIVYPLEVLRRKMQLHSMALAGMRQAGALHHHHLHHLGGLSAAASGLAAAAASHHHGPHQLGMGVGPQNALLMLSAAAVSNSPGLARVAAAVAAIVRADGLRGFYSGLVPNMLQVLPSAALSYYTYDTLKTALGA